MNRDQPTRDQLISAKKSWLGASRSSFLGNSEEIARRLEGQAERVRRLTTQAERVDPITQFQEFSRIATEIQHELLWGIANLNMDSLTRTSAEIETTAADIRQLEAGRGPTADRDFNDDDPEIPLPGVDYNTGS